MRAFDLLTHAGRARDILAVLGRHGFAEWLAQLDLPMHGAGRLLDYGCGSGILAVAALLLGAAQADAVDIDPQALQAFEQNQAALTKFVKGSDKIRRLLSLGG